MKELSIEEKAKHYNEAIERARVVYTYYCDDREQLRKIEFIFPELKESEDERMRAMAIKAIRIPEARSCIKNWGINPDDVIAWLEKQGNKDEEILVLKDQIESLHAAIKAIKETHRIELEKQKDPKYLDPLTCEPWSDEQTRRNLINFLKNLGATELPQASYNRYLSYLEKQGEQNPKFRVGDIIKHKEQGFTCKIIAVDNEYRLSGCIGSHLPFDSQDAYELVEQNLTWSKEDEKILKSIIINIENLQFSEDMRGKYCHVPNTSKNYYQIMIDWLKSLKDRVLPQPNQEWSEEDKEQLDRALYMMEQLDMTKSWDDVYNWLKSLRPQNNITDEELAQAKKDAYNDALDKIEYHSGEPTFDDGWSAAIWFLKKRNTAPQNTWKPSDVQMKTFEYYIDADICNKDKEILFGLYADLKKLREE